MFIILILVEQPEVLSKQLATICTMQLIFLFFGDLYCYTSAGYKLFMQNIEACTCQHFVCANSVVSSRELEV